MYSYIDGKFRREPTASLSDDLIFGFGLFETLRVYNFSPFMLDRHLKRLSSTASQLNIKVNSPTLKRAATQVIRRNRMPECIIRIVVTRNHEMVTTLPVYKIPATASLMVAPWKRARSKLSGLKTLNYLENHLARELARKKGAFEAIFCNDKGQVLEGSVSNIFIVQRGIIYTPPAKLGILKGITRQLVIDLARNAKINVLEKIFKLHDCFKADEVFITNSVMEILPVSKINGKMITGGQMSNFLLSRYQELK